MWNTSSDTEEIDSVTKARESSHFAEILEVVHEWLESLGNQKKLMSGYSSHVLRNLKICKPSEFITENQCDLIVSSATLSHFNVICTSCFVRV